jgi:RHS repeat-associated protein
MSRKYQAVTSIVAPLQLPADELQHVQYNLSNKVKQVSNNLGYMLSIEYGPDEQRIKSEYYIPSGNTSVLAKTKYFVGSDYEVETTPNGGERFLHYLPGGGLYISHPTPGSDSLDYVLTDYLGTWYKVITDNGATVEQYSFDPWGRRRNATDWTYTNVPNTFIFDRGYTGHEMLDAFGLINMNGRVYDPIVARFLSPDNYVQDPQFSQSYNRYSYCFNNPLKYSDPGGYHQKPLDWDMQNPIIGGGGYMGSIANGTYPNVFTF